MKEVTETRFYCPPQDIVDNAVMLTGEEAHHALSVLRVKKGDRISVVDGTGNEFSVLVMGARGKVLTGEIITRRRKANEPITQISLAQAVLRGERMDWVVEKGTEIGLVRIIPMVSERTQIPAEATAGLNRRHLRWTRLAISAMKQCGRTAFPEISRVTRFSDLLRETGSYDLCVLAWEGEKRRGFRELFRERRAELRSLLGIVGPEGGFTPEEVEQAEAVGAIPVSLGIRRLRSETAGIVLSALLLAQVGELG